MKKNLMSLMGILFLAVFFTTNIRADVIIPPLEIEPNPIEKTVRTESKFFQNITLTNKLDKRFKTWISSQLFYTDENGNKYEVELRKNTSWSWSPFLGIGIGGGRRRTGMGVEVSPNKNGRDVINTASGLNFKANEQKVLTVDFDFTNLRTKDKVRIGTGKISGHLIIKDRDKKYSDILVPIEIEIVE